MKRKYFDDDIKIVKLSVEDEDLAQKLAGMIRLERSTPFNELQPMAQARSKWVDQNIPTYKQIGLFERAKDIIKEQGEIQ